MLAIKVKFGPFMSSLNRETQAAWQLTCRYGKLPPQEELEYIDSSDEWKLQKRKILWNPNTRLQYDADLTEQCWYVLIHGQ